MLVPLFEEDGLRIGELAERSHLAKQTMTTMVRAPSNVPDSSIASQIRRRACNASAPHATRASPPSGRSRTVTQLEATRRRLASGNDAPPRCARRSARSQSSHPDLNTHDGRRVHRTSGERRRASPGSRLVRVSQRQLVATTLRTLLAAPDDRPALDDATRSDRVRADRAGDRSHVPV